MKTLYEIYALTISSPSLHLTLATVNGSEELKSMNSN